MCNYERFLELKRELDLSLDEMDAGIRGEVFHSLVGLLLKKSIYKKDGTIQKWRGNALQYLLDVVAFLGEDDIQQLLLDQETFFDRFVFTPCGRNSSLYALLRERNFNSSPFWNIPEDVLFNEFRARTGKSPYEKLPKTVVAIFIDEVESFC